MARNKYFFTDKFLQNKNKRFLQEQYAAIDFLFQIYYNKCKMKMHDKVKQMTEITQETRTSEMPRKKNLAWNITAMVLCFILLLLSVFFVMVSLYDFDKGEIPYLFRWGISSSNGEYEALQENALLFIWEPKNAAKIPAEEVIAFYYAEAPQHHKLYVGQLIDIEDDMAEIYVNDAESSVRVPVSAIRGYAMYSIGGLGYILSIFEGRYGLVLAIALVVLFVSLLILLVGEMVTELQKRKMLQAYADGTLFYEEGAVEELPYEETEQAYTGETEKIPAVGPLSNEAQILEKQEAPIEVEQDKQIEETIKTPSVIQEEMMPEEALAEEIEAPSVSQVEEAIETERELSVEEMAEANMVQAEDEMPVVEDALPSVESSVLDETLEDMPLADTRRVLTFAFSEKEADLMKRLLDIAAEKQERYNIFATINMEEGGLVVRAEEEDISFVENLVEAFKKRRQEKAE